MVFNFPFKDRQLSPKYYAIVNLLRSEKKYEIKPIDFVAMVPKYRFMLYCRQTINLRVSTTVFNRPICRVPTQYYGSESLRNCRGSDLAAMSACERKNNGIGQLILRVSFAPRFTKTWLAGHVP